MRRFCERPVNPGRHLLVQLIRDSRGAPPRERAVTQERAVPNSFQFFSRTQKLFSRLCNRLRFVTLVEMASFSHIDQSPTKYIYATHDYIQHQCRSWISVLRYPPPPKTFWIRLDPVQELVSNLYTQHTWCPASSPSLNLSQDSLERSWPSYSLDTHHNTPCRLVLTDIPWVEAEDTSFPRYSETKRQWHLESLVVVLISWLVHPSDSHE